jgi:hypothetical protein
MLELMTEIAAAVAFVCLGTVLIAAVVVPFVAGLFVRQR